MGKTFDKTSAYDCLLAEVVERMNNGKKLMISYAEQLGYEGNGKPKSIVSFFNKHEKISTEDQYKVVIVYADITACHDFIMHHCADKAIRKEAREALAYTKNLIEYS